MTRSTRYIATFLLMMLASLAFTQTPAATGTGSTNYITRWLSATQQGNSNIYENSSGWVGINTKTPKVTLDISNGNLIARGIGNFAGNGNAAYLYAGDTSHGLTAYRGGGLVAHGGTGINAYKATNGIFLQDTTGNVGIGNTNPQYPLDLGTYGSGRMYSLILRDQNGNSSDCLVLTNYSGSLYYYQTACAN
jgi:hypothetical protein